MDELKPLEGRLEVNGKVSYASQEPWVFSGTLRENVLFGWPFQKDWYNTVIKACALDKVISLIVSSLHVYYTSLLTGYFSTGIWRPNLDWRERSDSEWRAESEG